MIRSWEQVVEVGEGDNHFSVLGDVARRDRMIVE